MVQHRRARGAPRLFSHAHRGRTPRDPEQRAYIESLLSSLSPRAQAILRLRYGLSDENERCHGTTEIARLLGLSRNVVQATERDALQRLRALATGHAKISKQRGKPCISYTTYKPDCLTEELEQRLMQTYTRLHEQGTKVTGRLLAKEAKTYLVPAQAFLRLHADELPRQIQEQQRTIERRARLEAICKVLEAQGLPINGYRLAKAAHIGKRNAYNFVRAWQERKGAASHA